MRTTLIFLALVTACGGGTTTLPDDDTTAVETGQTRAYGSIMPADSQTREVSARGAIVSITPEELAPGITAHRVELAGDADLPQRSFRIVVPPDAALPFVVGDEIVLRIETLPGPPTYQPMNAIVTDSSGELLATYGVTPPSGWDVVREGEARRVDRGDYDEIEQYVRFTHAGETAVTDGTRWHRLATDDGPWLVSGSATDLEGTIPPDGGATFSFMIVRAR